MQHLNRDSGNGFGIVIYDAARDYALRRQFEREALECLRSLQFQRRAGSGRPACSIALCDETLTVGTQRIASRVDIFNGEFALIVGDAFERGASGFRLQTEIGLADWLTCYLVENLALQRSL